MFRTILILSFLFCSVLSCFSQTPLVHEKKIYVSPDQKVFVSKDQPVYFRISTSPDNNSQSYVLPSEKSAKYANPMYFDTEGLNTLRSPSAVDRATRKTVQPKQDVLFAIYADGKAPVSKLMLTGASRFVNHSTVYYGKNLSLHLASKDETSGVESSYISINESPFGEQKDAKYPLDQEREYAVSFYSVDHVGNAEVAQKEKFHVDLTPPLTSFAVIGDSKGTVLSSKAIISFTSRDTLSGVSKIYYSLNDGPEKIYAAPISLSVLKEGDSKITYYAVDNVGNKETPKVISATTGPMGENADRSTYSFYIDKEPPLIGFEIVGDQYKGKNLFVSERSLFKVNASDEKSGVEKTLYSIDNTLLKSSYTEPFLIKGEGLHSVTYAAADYVGNMAVAQTQAVCMDKTAPVSHVVFEGNKFVNRDTLFITPSTKIVISTAENGSGVQNINYALDGGNNQFYTNSLTVNEAGFHVMNYYASDHVNNKEEAKTCSFYVDNQPPQIYYNFSVKAIGEKVVRDEKYTIYPSNVMLYIASTDNASGVEGLRCRINGKEVPATNPLKGFLPGNYEVEVISSDVLKNRSSLVVKFSIEN